MFCLCPSSHLMTPELLECHTLSMTTHCCPAFHQDVCVFSQTAASLHQVCVYLCWITCESQVELKCVCVCAFSSSAESLMSSAPALESERVVCIVDLCLLGEGRVEMICSKLYRTADICQPDSTQWEHTPHKNKINHAKKRRREKSCTGTDISCVLIWVILGHWKTNFMCKMAFSLLSKFLFVVVKIKYDYNLLFGISGNVLEK